MVFMPAKTQGRDRKLARPYRGPYQVLNVTPTNVEVSLIDRPKDPYIFVSLNRVTPCYPRKRKAKSKKSVENTQSTHCMTQTLVIAQSRGL